MCFNITVGVMLLWIGGNMCMVSPSRTLHESHWYTGENTSCIENGATTPTSMIICTWYIERCQTHRKANPLQWYTVSIYVHMNQSIYHTTCITGCSKLQWKSLKCHSKIKHHHQCKLQQVAMYYIAFSFQVATNYNCKLQQIAMSIIALSLQIAAKCDCKLQ